MNKAILSIFFTKEEAFSAPIFNEY